MIVSRQFPTRLAILASSEYLFAQAPDAREINATIVGERVLSNGLQVLAVNFGLLAFDFANTQFGPSVVLEDAASGVVPDAVTESRNQNIQLQSDRLQLAVFVAACIYGRHSHMSHSALRGARYPGLDKIFGWTRNASSNELGLPRPEYDRLMPDMRERIEELRKNRRVTASIPIAHFEQGLDLAESLLAANQAASNFDYVSSLVMNYQAAILHQQQHAGASIALSAVVVEAALKEIAHVYGLVSGSTAQAHATRPHTCATVSRGKLKDLGFEGLLNHLRDGGLIDRYLAQRIAELRQARNVLMHQGDNPLPKQSGEALTVVRDVLRLLTGQQFELMTGWGYRT